jgi:hypothetical protein
MTTATRITALRYAMIVTGVISIFGIYTLIQIWPSGWSWGTAGSQYLTMLLGVYATLGVCLIVAARDPMANRSLVWFTVWANVVHALIMTAQAVMLPGQMGHLVGDVPALLLVAGVLAVLTPRGATIAAVTDRAARRAA